MLTQPMKIFGSSDSTGSSALIIENDNLSTDARLKFATTQNYGASVLVDKNNDHSVLDYYYPDGRRSPLSQYLSLFITYWLQLIDIISFFRN